MLFSNEKRDVAAIHPGSAALRRALRSNIVCFPSRIPALLKQPQADMQWRVVLLFFVRGWSSAKIGARFDAPKHRIQKILNDWSIRALALGYVQIIDAEAFAQCCKMEPEDQTPRDTREVARPPVSPLDAAGRPTDSPPENTELVAALDVAITHCEEWRGEFWARMATMLQDIRGAVALANGTLQQESPERAKERLYHAVA